MKLICYSVCLVFFFACGEASGESSSSEYVAPTPLEELIAPYQLEKKSRPTIEMFENSMVKEGIRRVICLSGKEFQQKRIEEEIVPKN